MWRPFKDKGVEGWKEGVVEEEGSATLNGAPIHIIVIWSFPSRKKEEECD